MHDAYLLPHRAQVQPIVLGISTRRRLLPPLSMRIAGLLFPSDLDLGDLGTFLTKTGVLVDPACSFFFSSFPINPFSFFLARYHLQSCPSREAGFELSLSDCGDGYLARS